MKNLFYFAVLLSSLFLFSQCQSEDDPGDCICIEIFNPVCGDDGVLYSNDCHAECAGVNYTPGYCPEQRDGMVLFLGDPALDGCGWVIQLIIDGNDIEYRPDTLADNFKVDMLPVNIQYKQILDVSVCGLEGSIPIIEVIEIKEL